MMPKTGIFFITMITINILYFIVDTDCKAANLHAGNVI